MSVQGCGRCLPAPRRQLGALDGLQAPAPGMGTSRVGELRGSRRPHCPEKDGVTHHGLLSVKCRGAKEKLELLGFFKEMSINLGF